MVLGFLIKHSMFLLADLIYTVYFSSNAEIMFDDVAGFKRTFQNFVSCVNILIIAIFNYFAGYSYRKVWQ